MDAYGVVDSRDQVDMEKVNDYIRFVLNVQTRVTVGEEQKKTNVIIDFRPCRKEDFIANGLSLSDEVMKKTVRHRICPDIDKEDKRWLVTNSYADSNFRQSFSLMLLRCNREYRKTCKDNNEV